MNKKFIKTNTIIWILFSFVLGLSFVNGARIYLDPEAAWLTKNCPSEISIMLDTQWKNTVAAEVVLFFNTWEINPISFEYGNAFKWWGLMQIIDNKIRMLWFGLDNVNWKYLFGKLKIESIWDTKRSNLNFQSSDGNTQSYLSYKWESLSTEFWNGVYSFFGWNCETLLSWEIINWPQDNDYMFEEYKRQFKILFDKKLREQRINRICIASWIVLLLIILLFLLYKKSKLFKFFKSHETWN